MLSLVQSGIRHKVVNLSSLHNVFLPRRSYLQTLTALDVAVLYLFVSGSSWCSLIWCWCRLATISRHRCVINVNMHMVIMQQLGGQIRVCLLVVLWRLEASIFVALIHNLRWRFDWLIELRSFPIDSLIASVIRCCPNSKHLISQEQKLQQTVINK